MISAAPLPAQTGGVSRRFRVRSISPRTTLGPEIPGASVGTAVVEVAAMARATERLTDLEVRRAKADGYYADGRGLYLQVRGVSKVWIHRYTFGGAERWMGLGPYPDVTLAMAREKAQDGRRLLLATVDPQVARAVARQAQANADARETPFRDCAAAYIEAHTAGWKNAKHAEQWTATFVAYVYPVMGDLAASKVDRDSVLKALKPIWTGKPETATRVRQRIEVVLDWAAVKGLRSGENPARWKGHLDQLLPRKSKVRAVKHFPAMPYADVPAYYASLCRAESYTARMLRLTILTAKRTTEVRHSLPEHVSLTDRVWTIPPESMKSSREFREPLSDQAREVIVEQLGKRFAGEVYVFPGLKRKTPLSEGAMLGLLKTTHGHLTVHGFRSSFRDWAADHGYSRDIAESALAHQLKDKTEAAYQRGDLLERRRIMMQAWADFVSPRL